MMIDNQVINRFALRADFVAIVALFIKFVSTSNFFMDRRNFLNQSAATATALPPTPVINVFATPGTSYGHIDSTYRQLTRCDMLGSGKYRVSDCHELAKDAVGACSPMKRATACN